MVSENRRSSDRKAIAPVAMTAIASCTVEETALNGLDAENGELRNKVGFAHECGGRTMPWSNCSRDGQRRTRPRPFFDASILLNTRQVDFDLSHWHLCDVVVLRRNMVVAVVDHASGNVCHLLLVQFAGGVGQVFDDQCLHSSSPNKVE